MGNKYESVPKPTPEDVAPERPDGGDSGPWGPGSVSLRSNAGRQAADCEREERLALVKARSRRALPRRGVAVGGLLALIGVTGWVALRSAGGGSESPALSVAGGTRPTLARGSAEAPARHRGKRLGTEGSRRRATSRHKRPTTAERRQAKDPKVAPTEAAQPEPELPPTSVESAPAPVEAAAEPTEPAASTPPPRGAQAASEEFGFEH
jgi:hypothetical protein